MLLYWVLTAILIFFDFLKIGRASHKSEELAVYFLEQVANNFNF